MTDGLFWDVLGLCYNRAWSIQSSVLALRGVILLTANPQSNNKRAVGNGHQEEVLLVP